MKRCIKRASVPMSFNTANDVTHADEILKVDVDEFASSVRPYILNHTGKFFKYGFGGRGGTAPEVV
eukprot:6739606-Lingulodinium_polyedra.AAC.1